MSDEPDKPWEIVESQYVIDTKYLRLRRDSIVLPGGERIDDYYVRESAGFSIIFAMTPDERVLLVRQYKHGIRKALLELPAGAIDPDESALACARRELEEETGYVSPSLEHIGTFITEPTSSNGRFFLFLGRDAKPTGKQNLEPTEQITIDFASLTDLRRYIQEGTIDVSPHVTAIYFTLDRLGKL